MLPAAISILDLIQIKFMTVKLIKREFYKMHSSSKWRKLERKRKRNNSVVKKKKNLKNED